MGQVWVSKLQPNLFLFTALSIILTGSLSPRGNPQRTPVSGSHEWGLLPALCSPWQEHRASWLLQSHSSCVGLSPSCSRLALHLKGLHPGTNAIHGAPGCKATYHWLSPVKKEEKEQKGRRKKGWSYMQYFNICKRLVQLDCLSILAATL